MAQDHAPWREHPKLQNSFNLTSAEIRSSNMTLTPKSVRQYYMYSYL